MAHPLEKKFQSAQGLKNQLRQKALRQVVRWEHWSGLHWHWDPSEIKTQQMDREPKAVKSTKSEGYYHYGIDREERVVMILRGEYDEEKGSRDEEFLEYSGNQVHSVRYVFERPKCACTATVENGKTVYVETVAYSERSGWMQVRWKNDQPVRLLFGYFGKKADMEWAFTEKGKLIGMYDLPRKLPKGANLESLSKKIGDTLRRSIPKTAAKAKIKHPAYCLLLCYDTEGNGVMPPMISIGLDRERQEMITRHGRAKLMVWNPDEFHHKAGKPAPIQADKSFEKACGWFNRILEDKGSDKPGRDLLNEVARDLGNLDWKKIMPVTDDFVVVAVDFEGADLASNIKTSAPADVLKKLKSAGLI